MQVLKKSHYAFDYESMVEALATVGEPAIRALILEFKAATGR